MTHLEQPAQKSSTKMPVPLEGTSSHPSCSGEPAQAPADHQVGPSKDSPLSSDGLTAEAAEAHPSTCRKKSKSKHHKPNIEKMTSRRLRKETIIGAMFGITLAVCIAVSLAMFQKNQQSKNEAEDAAQTDVHIPETVKKAAFMVLPKREQPTPRLGQKLPGNLGSAMVPPAEKPLSSSKLQKRYSHPVNYSRATRRRQEFEKARKASLFFGGASSGQTKNVNDAQQLATMQRYLLAQQKQLAKLTQAAGGAGGTMDALPSLTGPGGSPMAAQNMQQQKSQFLSQQTSGKRKHYLSQGLMQPISPHEVKAGTVIPAVLVTGINSDLPGEVIAQVRENIYDTVTGNDLLIPQGSRLLATYNSVLTYGQERVLICWNRLILPNGDSMDLECSPGADLSGYAGVSDVVDHHWTRLIVGVLLSSVLSASAPMASGNISGQHPTWPQQFGANAGQNFNSVGQAWAQKNMNIQPTITVRPGWSLNVIVNKDMILKPYKER